MSIRVEPVDLPVHIASRGGGFLLSSVMDSRPHAAHLPFQIAAAGGQVQLRAKVGRTSHHNCRQRPSVTVLWPALPAEHAPVVINGEDVGRYSLIVDGEARLDGDEHVVIAVTGAVFHRPAEAVIDAGGGGDSR